MKQASGQGFHPAMADRARSLAAPATPPIIYWARLGLLLLLGELYVLARWVSGPNFTPVPSGPDVPPGWMQAVFYWSQIGSVIGVVFCLYWFLARPWMRNRRVTVDGLLVVALLFLAPWDSLANYWQVWYTYNSFLVNFGSPIGDIPGALAYRAPGANETLPILAIPFVYTGLMMWIAMAACWIMRRCKTRWPTISTPGLIGVCLAVTMVSDLVLEGMLYMPLGFWSYVGGHWNINAGRYYQFPLHEMIMGGICFAGFCCIRYFVNDKGETLVERGLDRVQGTPARKTRLRFLAMIGGIHAFFIVFYHLPAGAIIGPHSAKWVEDSVSRSYFVNRMCGQRVNRACPGPDVPVYRPGAPYLDYQGRLVKPDETAD